ncbi:hypothetical protein FEM48_Zijuj11G0018400 [Ziziphus jujuba var. spinosa]|uniref:Zinc-ribbon domain-containing protein n=1 Tax=Ziziphus jujuba var. spinosa TaxID=714518 RepID=A0A978UG49_ZIZJJ|nr:hypothetical protein FEM48_Zijuj11G0018400 [Ziziphus jujuba var. spinosa]
MAEEKNVRLVRCPKCDNLQPELKAFSANRCGGCGVALRAKKKATENALHSEKSEEERLVGVAEKFENLVNKRGDSLNVASENEKEIDGVLVGRRKDRIFVERKANIITSCSSRTVVDEDVNVREGANDLRLKQSVAEKNYGSIEKYVRFSQHRDDQWAHGTSRYRDVNRFESVNSSVEENSTQRKVFAGSVRTRTRMKPQFTERAEGLYGNPRAISEQCRAHKHDEGPSTSEPDSYNGHREWMKNSDDLNVVNGVKDLEHDRFELLRKLDDLEQLSRSYNVADKPRERTSGYRTPPDPYGNQAAYNVSMQPPFLEKQIPELRYFNYRHGPVSSMNHHDIDRHSFYAPRRHLLNDIPEYEEPFKPQMDHEYLMAQYKDFKLDSHTSYPQEAFNHPPTCSCLHCYNQNWLVPQHVPPNVVGNRRFQNVPLDSNLYHPFDHVMFRPESYNPRGAYTPLHSHDPQPNTKWRSDLASGNDRRGQNFPRRGVAAHGVGRVYHPIAGGAPFIACCSCFELLKLPRKVRMKNKNQQKLRCGCCSMEMVFEIENKKLIFIPLESKGISAEVEQDSSESLNGNISSSLGVNAGCTNSRSDCPGSNFSSTGTNHNLLIEDQRLNSHESEERQSHTSIPTNSSKGEENPDCKVVVQRDVSDSAELPSENALSPTSPSSPLWQQSSDSPKYAISRYEPENKSSFTNNDNIVFNGTPSQHNSVKDISVTTEVDASFNEYLDTCTSQDSVEVGKEEDQHRINKGSNSFLVGFIKKSFRDFSRSNQSLENEMPNVSVNGELIPDRVVKKAEKLAGPIHPGDYWYDFRAGFWGVMGQRCLGIIPPCIEEFNYPMPTNCAAGNTDVYVNGRELNQTDLDLLSSRGLPTTRNKFYIIEISGRVLDEDTGKEFSLGKLAPTVLKTKRGFGMKYPKKRM